MSKKIEKRKKKKKEKKKKKKYYAIFLRYDFLALFRVF